MIGSFDMDLVSGAQGIPGASSSPLLTGITFLTSRYLLAVVRDRSAPFFFSHLYICFDCVAITDSEFS
jgi:hypothetical protein